VNVTNDFEKYVAAGKIRDFVGSELSTELMDITDSKSENNRINNGSRFGIAIDNVGGTVQKMDKCMDFTGERVIQMKEINQKLSGWSVQICRENVDRINRCWDGFEEGK
jgi:hypothetical protein